MFMYLVGMQITFYSANNKILKLGILSIRKIKKKIKNLNIGLQLLILIQVYMYKLIYKIIIIKFRKTNIHWIASDNVDKNFRRKSR